MAVFNSNGYYHSLDRFEGDELQAPIEVGGNEWKTKLGPAAIGTSANPFQHQIQALAARIREGARRVELNLPGAGKSNAQAPSAEAYGSRERQDMREMARAAGVKTSTHATFQRQGLSGLGERGFNDEIRYQNIKEVKKAIQFAAQATTGGAVVFHTGEWQRPISETWGAGKDPLMKDAAFRAFDEEDKRATFYMVDKRTGNFVSAISKDKELFRPVYLTAKDLVPEKIGKIDPLKGKPLEPDDYVDVDGNWIDETKPERLFERVPKWNKDHTNFDVEPVNWDTIVEETKRYNKKNKTNLTPEEMFVRIEVENQILQFKGSSLFYAQRYEEEKYTADKLREALAFYKQLDKNLPKEEKWKLITQRLPSSNLAYREGVIPGEPESIVHALERELKEISDRLRHVHEASSAADANAADRQRMLDNIVTAKEYGLKKSSQSIAELGLYAYDYTRKNKENLEDPIYIAPENWQTNQYGGHPAEMIELIKESRRVMERELMEKRGKSAREAKRLAQQHIKSTIDIGHLNLWRQHFQAKKGESEEERDKRFNKWAVAWTKKMIDEGVIGHLHIADNFGWDDEHLTPGEGNAPIREFIAELEKAGYKDFIVEPGSFNSNRAMLDAMKHIGSPIYSTFVPNMWNPRMGDVRWAHFGYGAPSNYIVGAYSPSNEWKLWSEVPLE